MPHAHFMPTVVFPDDADGHAEWKRWDKSEVTVPYFCDEFSRDDFCSKIACSRRNAQGDPQRNLCFRCVAGFLYDPSYFFGSQLA